MEVYCNLQKEEEEGALVITFEEASWICQSLVLDFFFIFFF